MQILGFFRGRDVKRIVREVKRYTLEELDFRREAFNASALHDMMLADDIDHYAPRPYFDRCGARVITLEQLEGVWLSDFLEAILHDDAERLAAWAERGIGRRRVARVIYRSTLEQAYHHPPISQLTLTPATSPCPSTAERWVTSTSGSSASWTRI